MGTQSYKEPSRMNSTTKTCPGQFIIINVGECRILHYIFILCNKFGTLIYFQLFFKMHV